MPLKVHVFPCLKDNYGFLLRDEATGVVACIDAPDAAATERELNQLGWGRIDLLLNTHWHADHTGGNAALKERFGLTILGPEEIRRVAPIDAVVEDGDHVRVGETVLEVIGLKGHTLGLIGYIEPVARLAFIADCLFALGCGRLFEGTAMEMWQSLKRLAHMPDDTLIYCAHEYTLANLAFAESLAEPGSEQAERLAVRGAEIRALRAEGRPTIPMPISVEKATNPFLVYPMRETALEDQARVFGELRAAKDRF